MKLVLAGMAAALALGMGESGWPQAAQVTGVDQMQLPPPIANRTLPAHPGAEAQSNFVSGSLIVSGGYTDNLYPGSASPVSDTIQTLAPTISVNHTSSRQQRSLTYSSGFTFYQPTDQLNQVDHNGTASFSYRLTPHVSLSLNDTFVKSSTAFATPGTAGGGISGALLPTTPGIVAPFAERINNDASADLSWQFGPHAMLSGGAYFNNLYFPSSSPVPGLYDSDARQGSASYVRAVSRSSYLGASYQYARMGVYPKDAPSEVITHTLLGFLTLYPRPDLSLSVAGGPQRLSSGLAAGPATLSWFPAVQASLGWQGFRGSVAGVYARLITGGGGMIGAFQSSSGTLATRWVLTQRWTVGGSGTYALNVNVGAPLPGAVPNGRTVLGGALVERGLGPNVTMSFSYDRLHQTYQGIPLLAGSPDTDREMVTLSYHFTRPLGR